MANVKQRFVNHWTWYYSFGGIFLALAAIYIALHIFFAGEERLAFSKEDITNIQTIINAINARDKSDSLFPCIIRHDRPASKTEGSDTTKGGQKKQDGNSGKPQDKKGNGIVKIRGCELCPPQNHSDSILYSIDSYIRAKYPVKDTCDYLSFMVQFQMVDFNITFLTGYNLRVDSYFWLTENKVFLEIIFWTLFGLLSNLFYHVSEAFRTNTYNKTEAYVHWAKLIYSPVISIVIYFSIEALIADGQASLNNLRFGLIVLSFILGFFSGRTIDLLNRLKDIILPLGKGNAPTETEVHDVSGTVSFTNENVKRFADQMTKIVVKFFSMNDPSLNDIANPSSEGNFTFNTVPSGEYIIKAEFKFENEVYEGTVTIRVPLTPEQSANITLVQTTQPDVRPA